MIAALSFLFVEERQLSTGGAAPNAAISGSTLTACFPVFPSTCWSLYA